MTTCRPTSVLILIYEYVIREALLYLGGSGMMKLMKRMDEDTEEEEEGAEGVTCPPPGEPFSALLPSMLPQDLKGEANTTKDPNSQPAYRCN